MGWSCRSLFSANSWRVAGPLPHRACLLLFARTWQYVCECHDTFPAQAVTSPNTLRRGQNGVFEGPTLEGECTTGSLDLGIKWDDLIENRLE